MARPTAIPHRLHDAVLEKAGENWGTRRISDWLKTEHKVNASHNAVAKLLRELRKGREEVTRAVVAEKLSGTVTKDLDVLSDLRESALSLAKRYRERLDGPPLPAPDDLNGSGAKVSALYDAIERTPVALVYEKLLARAESLTARRLALSGARVDESDLRPKIFRPEESDD